MDETSDLFLHDLADDVWFLETSPPAPASCGLEAFSQCHRTIISNGRITTQKLELVHIYILFKSQPLDDPVHVFFWQLCQTEQREECLGLGWFMEKCTSSSTPTMHFGHFCANLSATHISAALSDRICVIFWHVAEIFCPVYPSLLLYSPVKWCNNPIATVVSPRVTFLNWGAAFIREL